MPLFEGTQQQYYGSQTFIQSGNASSGTYNLSFPANQTLLNSLSTMPTSSAEFTVTVNNVATTSFTYNATTYVVTVNQAVSNGDSIVITLINPQLGNYQFISLKTIVDNFIISYVGNDKIIPRTRRSNVAFHAQRAIQELSYDTFKSIKSQEIELPPNLKMALPHDYVNYVKVCYVDNDGVEKLLYPTRKTSNPTAILQDGAFNYTYDSSGNLSTPSDSTTWSRFQASSDENANDSDADTNDEDFNLVEGRRYGLEPEMAQSNGVFYIDEQKGYIHFNSSMSGKLISLKYISDGLATDDEMLVHKFAEEAVYKHIAYAIASTHTSVAPTYIPLLKKERFAATRKAKLRLSNLKIEELTQVMRGKSKQIKH